MSNTGDCNTGDSNTGDYNTGDSNTGDCNTGDSNTGDYNTGDCNTGDSNTGDCNTGDNNTGYNNAGDCNTGDSNTGYNNAGDYNTGDYNTGDYNTGFFCTETPRPMFFDCPCNLSWKEVCAAIPHVELPVLTEWIVSSDMSDDEKKEYPEYYTLGGYLKAIPMPLTESFPVAWAKLSNKDKERFKNLPNFNAEKFLVITGVDVRKAL